MSSYLDRLRTLAPEPAKFSKVPEKAVSKVSKPEANSDLGARQEAQATFDTLDTARFGHSQNFEAPRKDPIRDLDAAWKEERKRGRREWIIETDADGRVISAAPPKWQVLKDEASREKNRQRLERLAEPSTVNACRRWRVTLPDGTSQDLSYAPPATAAEVAGWWPPGSALAPLPDAPLPKATPELPAAQEAAVRRWLTHIGETDPAIIGEVLGRCRQDPGALAYFTQRAAEVPDRPSGPVRCQDCRHALATDHPFLVACAVNAPCSNPTGRFWKTDPRGCEQWETN